MSDLGPRYEHKEIEADIYRKWEDSGYFNPDKLSHPKSARAFSIIMPPPNANGSLHMGHAVFVTLQDIMIRYARMQGKRALWLPGADHAGFETQTVFDKKLDKEGRNRFAMDREALWREIWEFTQVNKKIMEGQMRKLGASCDWSRETFTLDPKIIKGVYETFEKMYKDGLVYRDLRVVNWCPKHRTALSDLEVKYVERIDPLYYIKYGPLTLATVRPETKFGDTALAVNPKDKRYQKYIGKEIEAESVLGKLKFKVVGDEVVDPKFGTGVIKVTPAHDVTDFEIWQRHKNEIPGPVVVIDESGRLTIKTGRFAGMKVEEARGKVAEAMEEVGILEKVDPEYKHQVATCYKCNSTLEPLPKPQWFVKMESLAKKAMEAADKGRVKFYPVSSKKIYTHWLKNIRDWNISRQIIWGIRIPTFYDIFENANSDCVIHIKQGSDAWKKWGDVVKCGPNDGGGNSVQVQTGEDLIRSINFKKAQYVLKEKVLTFQELKNSVYKFDISINAKPLVVGSATKSPANSLQDPDVFDTWFSSGQWPFLTLLAQSKKVKREARNVKQELGTSKDFEEFYPTDVMETGYDILFFWVTRMMMLGLYRTGKVPFKNVYLHGLVRDKDRQKMSKSKGNVVDPLGVAEEYGTDAVRMALTAGNTAGNDIIISEDKIRGYRNFATKIWNIARFVLMQKENVDGAGLPKSKILAHDKKVLEQAKKTRQSVGKYIEKFQFHLAGETAYHYIWHTFADKIIEESKSRFSSEKREERVSAYLMLLGVLKECLLMLHPFMPFVTEAVYEHLPSSHKDSEFLMTERWGGSR